MYVFKSHGKISALYMSLTAQKTREREFSREEKIDHFRDFITIDQNNIQLLYKNDT